MHGNQEAMDGFARDAVAGDHFNPDALVGALNNMTRASFGLLQILYAFHLRPPLALILRALCRHPREWAA